MRRRPRRDVIWERFGDPIGSYAGDAPVGVRSVQAEVGCPCGCDGSCGCATGEDEMCTGCGMPVDMCRCSAGGTCPTCDMVPVMGRCGCPMAEAITPMGMIPPPTASPPCPECGGRYAIDGDEPGSFLCHDCGATYDADGNTLDLNEGDGLCGECGTMEIEGHCECSGSGMSEGKLSQVTPRGYEDIVLALKKEHSVRNPWAVAWSMKSKGIKPKRKKRR